LQKTIFFTLPNKSSTFNENGIPIGFSTEPISKKLNVAFASQLVKYLIAGNIGSAGGPAIKRLETEIQGALLVNLSPPG